MSVHRFFAPSLDPGDEAVDLPRDEAEHLTRVLRLGVGDTVSVFNGRGHEFLARIVSAARRDARVQLLSRVEPAPESTTPLTLVQAVLKGDKMDDVIRDAVMLGVAAIQPIVSKRTEYTVAAILRGTRMDRWRRIALASAKQSRRAVVPEIMMPLTLETWLDEPAPGERLMFVGAWHRRRGATQFVPHGARAFQRGSRHRSGRRLGPGRECARACEACDLSRSADAPSGRTPWRLPR